MKTSDLEERIVETLDVEKHWLDYLKENEMSFGEKWKFCWESAKVVYKKGGATFALLVLITMTLHGVMETATTLPLPAFLKNSNTFLYLTYSFMVLVPPFYGMWINRTLTHKDGTYGKQEFVEVVCGGIASEHIASLLDLAIKNSTTAARHRRNIQRMLRDISILKYATQRGGRSTVEMQNIIKEVLDTINKRLTLLKDALEGYEVQHMIQYSINHPDCVRAKNRVAEYFTDGVELTLVGYQKLNKVVTAIHAAYLKHEDPKPAHLAELDKIEKLFYYHNEKLLGGNLRKSA